MRRAVCLLVALFLLGLAEAAVAAKAGKEPPPGKAPVEKGQLTLVCQAQAQIRYLTVDYTRKTVNGALASITETAITWAADEPDSIRKRTVRVRNELNRLEGSYRFWVDGEGTAEATPKFSCEKAPQPKL